mmetsp:Transcript_4858/g.12132  ORF Transcript_4858/g.12132 Transcript_4858/m.12132 type:complete len:363 (-) Transcript_4858:416-1504(-)
MQATPHSHDATSKPTDVGTATTRPTPNPGEAMQGRVGRAAGLQQSKSRATGYGYNTRLPLSRRPLELCHERHMVGRPLRVGQAAVLGAHLGLRWELQKAERRQGVVRVEDVVQRTHELCGTVGEERLARAGGVHAGALPLRRFRLQARLLGERGVGRHQRERVLQLGGGAQDAEGVGGELGVRSVHPAGAQQVVGCRTRHRVEVPAHHHGNLRAGGDLLQSLEQSVHLPQLDVVELRVGVNVGVGHAQQLALALWRRHAGLLQRLQHNNERHVILHKPVQRVLLGTSPAQRLHQRQRRLVELYLVLFNEGEAVFLKEDGAPVDHVRALREHLRRFLLVYCCVPMLGQFAREKILEVVALHLL